MDSHLYTISSPDHFWYFSFFIPQGFDGLCTPVPGRWYTMGLYCGHCLYPGRTFVFNQPVCKNYKLLVGGNADYFYSYDPPAQLYEFRRQGYAANGSY